MLKLLHFTSCRFCDKMETQTKSEERLIAGKHLLKVFYGLRTVTWTSGTVRHIYSVIFKGSKIIVIRHSDHLDSTCDEVSDYAMLHSAVHKNNLLTCCSHRLATVDVFHILSGLSRINDHILAADISRSRL